jgi:RNA polymerase sigma factor (sigma-70 family)
MVTNESPNPPRHCGSRQTGASLIRDAFHAGEEGAVTAVRLVLHRALRQAHVRPEDAAACAEDLVAEVWLDITPRSRDDATFLREARRLAWRYARRAAREDSAPLELAALRLVDRTDPTRGAVRAEMRELLSRMLRSLGPESRRFFRLRYFRGTSLRACSARLRLSFRAARMHEVKIRAATLRLFPCFAKGKTGSPERPHVHYM